MKKYFFACIIFILFLGNINANDAGGGDYNLIGTELSGILDLSYNGQPITSYYTYNSSSFGGVTTTCNLTLDIGDSHYNGVIEYRRKIFERYGLLDLSIDMNGKKLTGMVSAEADYEDGVRKEIYFLDFIIDEKKLNGEIYKDFNPYEIGYKLDFSGIEIDGQITQEADGFKVYFYYDFKFGDKIIKGQSSPDGFKRKYEYNCTLDNDMLFVYFLLENFILNCFQFVDK